MDKMVNFFITSRGKQEIFSYMFQHSYNNVTLLFYKRIKRELNTAYSI